MIKPKERKMNAKEQAFIEGANECKTSINTSTSTSTSTNSKSIKEKGLDPNAPRHKGTNLKMNQYEYEIFQQAVGILKQENSKANMTDLIRSAALDKAIEIIESE